MPFRRSSYLSYFIFLFLALVKFTHIFNIHTFNKLQSVLIEKYVYTFDSKCLYPLKKVPRPSLLLPDIKSTEHKKMKSERRSLFNMKSLQQLESCRFTQTTLRETLGKVKCTRTISTKGSTSCHLVFHESLYFDHSPSFTKLVRLLK